METKELEKWAGVSGQVAECGFVPKAAFETEKRAKNKAFYFILAHGLYDEYVAFDRAYESDDPHEDCVKWLSEQRDKIRREGEKGGVI